MSECTNVTMVDYKLCLIRDDTCWKSGYFLAPNKSCGEFCSDASKFACLRIFLLFFYVFFSSTLKYY